MYSKVKINRMGSLKGEGLRVQGIEGGGGRESGEKRAL